MNGNKAVFRGEIIGNMNKEEELVDMAAAYNIFVLVKQVPDQGSKAGT